MHAHVCEDRDGGLNGMVVQLCPGRYLFHRYLSRDYFTYYHHHLLITRFFSKLEDQYQFVKSDLKCKVKSQLKYLCNDMVYHSSVSQRFLHCTTQHVHGLGNPTSQ